MKKIPELRFPGFSMEWEKDKLHKHTGISDGTHQTPKYTDIGVKFVSVENIKDLIGTTKYISEEDYNKEYRRKEAKKGDILMTRIGDIGTPAMICFDEPLAYYVTLSLIKCTSKKLISDFLYQYIQTSSFQRELFKRTLHVAFPKKINLGEIGYSNISFPNLEEQTKIAKFLSKLDKRLELQQEKMELLEEKKKGILQKIFSQEIRFKDENGEDYPEWEEKRLEEVCSVTNGKGDVQDSKDIGKYPFFDRSEVLKYVDEYLFDNEAIIYSGEGSEFYPRYYNGKYGLHQRCYSLHDFNKDIVNPKFLYQSLFLKNNYFVSVSVGSTVPSLRMNNFYKLEVNFPVIEEQQKIASFLSSIDLKIEKEKEKLEQLKELKKGLLQRMFV